MIVLNTGHNIKERHNTFPTLFQIVTTKIMGYFVLLSM